MFATITHNSDSYGKPFKVIIVKGDEPEQRQVYTADTLLDAKRIVKRLERVSGTKFTLEICV